MDAAKAQLERLQARRGSRLEPVVVSVAGLTIDEFLACHTALQPLCDAIELNISSPNTRGIRVFQEPQSFRDLLSAVNAQRSKPLFVKIPPYTDGEGRERVLALARIAVEQGVSGITAANTRPVEAPRLAMGQGGLSGRVLLEDTLRIVADVRSEVGSDVAIHACGGISTTDDAFRALKTGADTVQLLTGLIYRGPGVAGAINRGLVKCMERHAAASLGRPGKNRCGRVHSINPGENAVLHPRLILRPLFGAVFLGTVPVVVTLTEGEQRDYEDKVDPRPGVGEVAEYQAN